MNTLKTLVGLSHGPHNLTPRSPFIDAGPIHGAFFVVENAAIVSSEGSGPEGGTIVCRGGADTRGSSVRVVLDLETGWRLLVTFKSTDHDRFKWHSFIAGDDDGEAGDVQYDTALKRFYFVLRLCLVQFLLVNLLAWFPFKPKTWLETGHCLKWN